jgi:hypothetical protein
MTFRVTQLLHATHGRRPGGLLLAAVVLLALGACTPTSAPAAGAASTAPFDSTVPSATGATQVRDGGQVSLAVTWRGPEAGAVFLVAMDTHSVDLDSLDLAQLATLKTPAGELSPTGWEAPKGGHHRAGTLTFAATTADGRPTIGGGPIELLIRDVAGVPERSFQWQP